MTVRGFALAMILTALMAPAGALAATATVPGTKIHIPASALPQGTSSTGTATEQSPTSTPTTTAGGAQPGTVAPGSSTPATTTTSSIPTTTTPGATTPQGATPTGPTGPATLAPATTGPGTPATLGIVRAKPHQKSKGLSGLALVLAIVGVLLILACLVWAIARWMGLQPRWSTAMMYSLREASYHASATWAEFSDWARIGH